MTEWLELIGASSLDGLILCLEIALLIAPLLFGYEMAKAYGIFEKRVPGVEPILARLGLGPGALVPLLAGLFLGLIYGAAIMLTMTREKGLSRGERMALAVFLVTCHAVIEDTAIFVLLGGSTLGMLGPRLLLAVALCVYLARRQRDRFQA